MKLNEQGTRAVDRDAGPAFTLPGSPVGHRFAKIAAGFWISESTAHACTSAVVDLFAERAPGLMTLGNHDLGLVPLDGTLAESDRVLEGRPGGSGAAQGRRAA